MGRDIDDVDRTGATERRFGEQFADDDDSDNARFARGRNDEFVMVGFGAMMNVS
jgi:hypothetical protein